MRLVWILSALVAGAPSALAEDTDGDGCDDAQYTANTACISPTASVDPTVTTVAGTVVGDSASVGPFVALDDVYIAPYATLDGWDAHSIQPLTIGAGTVIGRRATLGVDHIIGPDTTIGRSVTAGPRLTTGTGAAVGYAVDMGSDVTLDTNATVGNLADLGDFTHLGPSATVARGTAIEDASSSAEATDILGTVGPNVAIGSNVLVASSARVRKDAALQSGAQVLAGARVGRGATVQAGATVSGTVPANATVCAGATLGADDYLGRNGTWPDESCSEPANNSPGTAGDTCASILAASPSSATGAYYLDPVGNSDPLDAIRVWCDMDTLGGGWTVMKQFASGAYYSNTGATLTYNPAGQASVSRGTIDDHQYNHAYWPGLRSASTQTLIGWDFETTVYADIPQGYVVWNLSPDAFNPLDETSTSCAGAGVWTRDNSACDYGGDNSNITAKSHAFTVGWYAFFDFQSSNTDYSTWGSYAVWENHSNNIYATDYDDGHVWIAFR